MQRSCDACGDPYEAKTSRSRFCSVACRVAQHRADHGAGPDSHREQAGPGKDRPSRGVQPALMAEFEKLGVAEEYEARVALGLAEQLDSRVLVGAAYVSLSKELDRRVDALRLKAERPDDPAAAVKGRLAEKRLRLA